MESLADGLELGVDGGVERGGGGVAEIGEVKAGEVTAELEGGFVVGQSGFMGGVKGAEPEPCAVLREADLGHPFAPVTLPHATVELARLGRRWSSGVLHWKWLHTEKAPTFLVVLHAIKAQIGIKA